MKKLILILPLLFVSMFASAQPEHKVAIAGKTVVFEEIDNLIVVGYDGTDLRINREGGHSSKDDKRAEGLRKISAAGKKDNTGFGLNSMVRDGEVVISQVGRGNGTIRVQVPNNAVVRIEQSTTKGGDIEVSGFRGDLEVSMHYHKVRLSNVYGPTSINSIYGSIEMTFSDGPPTQPLRLHSTYQNVDLTLPQNTKANLRLSTSYGDMYTDFDIDMKANMDEAGQQEDHDDSDGLTGTLNGGGELISLTASYRNIYLRKL